MMPCMVVVVRTIAFQFPAMPGPEHVRGLANHAGVACTKGDAP